MDNKPRPPALPLPKTALSAPDALEVPGSAADDGRPALMRHASSPVTILRSPSRHHKRTHSSPRHIKETLDASLQYNDDDDRRINQYVLKQEIGRGSFGSVHLAVDTDGVEYAVKEFSKSRLRKQAHTHILRRGPHLARRGGQLNSPLHRRVASDIANDEEGGNPLYLIRTEIAVMKKLNHENLVNLVEVLDDPEGDSLYMVLEMCAKGVVMKVGVGETTMPLAEDDCRYWFRDLILGIEYLHHQGIVHRDIKPDNLLLNSQNVLKIVDFGVSEIFDKAAQGDMRTSKSAGSPAFLPPEMCVVTHENLDGRAIDIWSMGVSLYCFYYGKLPYDHQHILDLYEAIRSDKENYLDDTPPELIDLFKRIFEKDPDKRIKMRELRVHPWVTKNGEDMLLSYEENTSETVEAPTREEIDSAITKGIRNVMAAAKAVTKFKNLVRKRRQEKIMGTLWGDRAEMQQSPPPMSPPQAGEPQSNSLGDGVSGETSSSDFISKLKDFKETGVATANSQVKRMTDYEDAGLRALATFGASRQDPALVHQLDNIIQDKESGPDIQISDSPMDTLVNDSLPPSILNNKALGEHFEDEPLPFLGIGDPNSLNHDREFLTKSPAPTEDDIYEQAYQEKVKEIMQEQGNDTKVHSTNRLESNKK